MSARSEEPISRRPVNHVPPSAACLGRRIESVAAGDGWRSNNVSGGGGWCRLVVWCRPEIPGWSFQQSSRWEAGAWRLRAVGSNAWPRPADGPTTTPLTRRLSSFSSSTTLFRASRASRARSGHLPGLMRSPTSPSAASQRHRRGCTKVG